MERPPPLTVGRRAWPGGSTVSNRDEALSRFLERKSRENGALSSAQQQAGRALRRRGGNPVGVAAAADPDASAAAIVVDDGDQDDGVIEVLDDEEDGAALSRPRKAPRLAPAAALAPPPAGDLAALLLRGLPPVVAEARMESLDWMRAHQRDITAARGVAGARCRALFVGDGLVAAWRPGAELGAGRAWQRHFGAASSRAAAGALALGAAGDGGRHALWRLRDVLRAAPRLRPRVLVAVAGGMAAGGADAGGAALSGSSAEYAAAPVLALAALALAERPDATVVVVSAVPRFAGRHRADARAGAAAAVLRSAVERARSSRVRFFDAERLFLGAGAGQHGSSSALVSAGQLSADGHEALLAALAPFVSESLDAPDPHAPPE